MTLKCLLGAHTWNDCKCLNCGKVREGEHQWSKDCGKCSVCGKTRDGHHDWGKDCEKCGICGSTKSGAHKWDEFKCAICGVPRYSAAQLTDKIVDAAKDGDLVRIKGLLEVMPGLASSADGDAWTPLHAAVFNGHEEAAALLLASRANVKVKDKQGWTPLHAAAFKGSAALAKLLVSNKAEIDAVDGSGATPLHWATHQGHRGVAEFLIAKGADVSWADESGCTPLHWAAIYGHKNVAELLLDEKADVNAADRRGQTPLLLALAKNYAGIADLLRRNGGVTEASTEAISPEAEFDRGSKYMKKDNYAGAARCFEAAAKRGHTKAKNMLGVAMVQMNGDILVAYRWICEAADEGNDVAVGNRDTLKRFLDRPSPGPRSLPLYYSW